MLQHLSFFAADSRIPVPQRTALKRFLAKQIVRARGKGLAFQIRFVFCSDEYLLKINRQFLKHDYYTDIITFPLTNTEKMLEAEIYISVERVKENSQQIDNQKNIVDVARWDFSKYQEELHRVIFHGVLHLLGYNDKTSSQKSAMRQAEDEWLKSYNMYLRRK